MGVYKSVDAAYWRKVGMIIGATLVGFTNRHEAQFVWHGGNTNFYLSGKLAEKILELHSRKCDCC